MKRAQALKSIGLGGWLVLGLIAPYGEASPYVTHRTTDVARVGDPIALPSCSSVPVPELSSGPVRMQPFDVGFEPGIGNALESHLPLPITRDPDRPAPIPPPGHESGKIASAPPISQKRTVPEPASIVLVVTGLIGLAARRHLLRNRI